MAISIHKLHMWLCRMAVGLLLKTTRANNKVVATLSSHCVVTSKGVAIPSTCVRHCYSMYTVVHIIRTNEYEVVVSE